MLKQAFNKIDYQKRAIDISQQRQKILANNIANVETPGFKRSDIDFDKSFSEYLNQSSINLKTTHKNHISTNTMPSYYVKKDKSYSHRIDGNNVNIDYEMAETAKNNIKHDAMIARVSGQLKRLTLAIKGGR